MKLEFLDVKGHSAPWNLGLVRLYDFDRVQMETLSRKVEDEVRRNGRDLALHAMAFIEPLNCELTFRVGDENEGIIVADHPRQFVFVWQQAAYDDVIGWMKSTASGGHNWLNGGDCGDRIDLLFSPHGTW